MSAPERSAAEWLEAIHAQFEKETDRAAAVLVGAMLDEVLASLLRKRLIPPLSKERSLLDSPYAPLGTFSARIDAAYQLGLISSYLARDLHLIRKIRNEFAHEAMECAFNDQRIADWVAALEATSRYNSRDPVMRGGLGPAGPRWDFLGISAWILYSLGCELQETPPLQEHKPEFGYIDWQSLTAEVRKRITDAEAT